MAFEKKWPLLPLTPLSSDGTDEGQLQVVDAFKLKVKQIIYLKSNTLPPMELQVKRVIDPITFLVGRPGYSIDDRSDVSAYTVADSAAVFQTDHNKLNRPTIGPEEYSRAVYDEEPTVALRSVLVDRGGRYIGSDADSPFYVQLTDGSVNIGTVHAQLETFLTHKDNDPDPGDVHSSVRIGDGINELAVEPDGSINVNANIGVSNASIPNVQNIAIPTANVEQSYVIPTGTRKFKCKLRNVGAGPGLLKVAYIQNESATNFLSISPGAWYAPASDVKTLAGLTIYFQATKDNQILEFESWA